MPCADIFNQEALGIEGGLASFLLDLQDEGALRTS